MQKVTMTGNHGDGYRTMRASITNLEFLDSLANGNHQSYDDLLTELIKMAMPTKKKLDAGNYQLKDQVVAINRETIVYQPLK